MRLSTFRNNSRMLRARAVEVEQQAAEAESPLVRAGLDAEAASLFRRAEEARLDLLHLELEVADFVKEIKQSDREMLIFVSEDLPTANGDKIHALHKDLDLALLVGCGDFNREVAKVVVAGCYLEKEKRYYAQALKARPDSLSEHHERALAQAAEELVGVQQKAQALILKIEKEWS